MALAGGFRRIVIVLSVFLASGGFALDALLLIPHTTVRVTLNDGRQETIEVQWVGDYPTDRQSLARELSERHGLGGRGQMVDQSNGLQRIPPGGDGGQEGGGHRARSGPVTQEEFDAAFPVRAGDVQADRPRRWPLL